MDAVHLSTQNVEDTDDRERKDRMDELFPNRRGKLDEAQRIRQRENRLRDTQAALREKAKM